MHLEALLAAVLERCHSEVAFKLVQGHTKMVQFNELAKLC